MNTQCLILNQLILVECAILILSMEEQPTVNTQVQQAPVNPEAPKPGVGWDLAKSNYCIIGGIILILFLIFATIYVRSLPSRKPILPPPTSPSSISPTTPFHPSPTPNPTANWKTYTNFAKAINLKYPDYWNLQDYSSEIKFTNRDGKSSLTIFTIDPNLSLVEELNTENIFIGTQQVTFHYFISPATKQLGAKAFSKDKLLILDVDVGIYAVIYYLDDKTKETDLTTIKQILASVKPIVRNAPVSARTWKSYMHPDYKYTLDYPTDYVMEEGSTLYLKKGVFPGTSSVAKSLIEIAPYEEYVAVDEQKNTPFEKHIENIAKLTFQAYGHGGESHFVKFTKIIPFTNKFGISGYELYVQMMTKDNNIQTVSEFGPVYAFDVTGETKIRAVFLGAGVSSNPTPEELEILRKIRESFRFSLTGEDDQVVCTQDVKECSDGSYVSRQPPTCEFTKCP